LQRVGMLLYRAIGAATAIAIMEFLAGYADEPLGRVPFVTSIVLVMGLPDSEASRPYAVIAGHMCSCVAGLAALLFIGQGNTSSAIGVGLATLGMLVIRAPHPPAGIDAFLIPANNLPLGWIVSPVMIGSILLVVFSQGWSLGERAIFRHGKLEARALPRADSNVREMEK
jgi:CBS-domain-containing membrane protein